MHGLNAGARQPGQFFLGEFHDAHGDRKFVHLRSDSGSLRNFSRWFFAFRSTLIRKGRNRRLTQIDPTVIRGNEAIRPQLQRM